jgi:hypothetical protein
MVGPVAWWVEFMMVQRRGYEDGDGLRMRESRHCCSRVARCVDTEYVCVVWVNVTIDRAEES